MVALLQTPLPGFRGKGPTSKTGESEGKGKEEEGKGGTPKGWLTPPMFQILKIP